MEAIENMEYTDKIDLSLVVPCYNEQEALPYFYKELKKVIKELPYQYEIVFVNDGSKDDTLSVLREMAREDVHVKYISFSRNFGKEAAMYAGFCNIKGRFAAVMDADMQDPPQLLPEMIDILEKDNYDSVATRRVTRQGEPVIRSFFARAFYKIINKISDIDIVDGARDFRLMKRKMVDAVVKMGENNRFSKGIFGWIGFRTKWISYENVQRTAGETKWNFWKLLKYAIDGITNFSQTPLSMAAWFGMIMTIISFFSMLFIICRKLIFDDPVNGWASLACIITLTGGVQLFCIGIIGHYIAKIYLEVKKRPHYIVEESNFDLHAAGENKCQNITN